MNFIVKNEHYEAEKDLQPSLFGQEEVEFVSASADIYDILVLLGAFPSKGQARKNWKQTGATIPLGFNEFTVGKLKRQFWAWNPIATREL